MNPTKNTETRLEHVFKEMMPKRSQGCFYSLQSEDHKSFEFTMRDSSTCRICHLLTYHSKSMGHFIVDPWQGVNQVVNHCGSITIHFFSSVSGELFLSAHGFAHVCAHCCTHECAHDGHGCAHAWLRRGMAVLMPP